MTLKQFYEDVANGLNTEEIKLKAEEQLTKLNKRDEKKNAKNEPLLDAMREIVSDEPMTASEIKPLFEDNAYTIQKVSALLRILKDNEEIKVVPVKREGKSAQNAYILIDEEVEEE